MEEYKPKNSQARIKANNRYRAKTYKRLAMDIRPEVVDEIKETATSILLEKGEKALRSVIIADTMKAFEAYYENFKISGDLSLIREIYEKRLINMGKKVRVLDPKGEYEGTALGINERGELKVRKDDGDICEVFAGEVSVRGIYGYV